MMYMHVVHKSKYGLELLFSSLLNYVSEKMKLSKRIGAEL
jgi:hypothetical protein